MSERTPSFEYTEFYNTKKKKSLKKALFKCKFSKASHFSALL